MHVSYGNNNFNYTIGPSSDKRNERKQDVISNKINLKRQPKRESNIANDKP